MPIRSIKVKANLKRNTVEKVADWLTAKFGSVFFLTLNLVWFITWLVINLDLIPALNRLILSLLAC